VTARAPRCLSPCARLARVVRSFGRGRARSVCGAGALENGPVFWPEIWAAFLCLRAPRLGGVYLRAQNLNPKTGPKSEPKTGAALARCCAHRRCRFASVGRLRCGAGIVVVSGGGREDRAFACPLSRRRLLRGNGGISTRRTCQMALLLSVLIWTKLPSRSSKAVCGARFLSRSDRPVRGFDRTCHAPRADAA
jgi:hypothetical protein